MKKLDTIIIGAGAAGLMLANQLNEHSHEFLLIERNDQVGKKLLLTGNKRCNVTNNLAVEQFIQALTFKHKRFLYPALTRFDNHAIIQFFKTHGVALKLEENFKYFPEADKSEVIINALLKGIDPMRIRLNQTVKDIIDYDGTYLVKTNQEDYLAKHVVVATGSMSFPHTGSTGDGLDFAKRLNIKTTPFTPAETVVYSDQVTRLFKEVQGTVIKDVNLFLPNQKKPMQGDILFTHFGLSGPLIMHASEFIYDALSNNLRTVKLCFLPFNPKQLEDKLFMLKETNQSLHDLISPYFTKRFTKHLITLLADDIVDLQNTSNKRLRKLAHDLLNFPITIDKVQSASKAYVNKGGVDTKALNPKTMEVKLYPGLYFIGETVDVHGPIGGFNLTIAFSTAYSACMSIIKKHR